MEVYIHNQTQKVLHILRNSQTSSLHNSESFPASQGSYLWSPDTTASIYSYIVETKHIETKKDNARFTVA